VGAGANLIIRRSILEETGPICELLGPGTPTYSAEDAYLIYKVAKSGHTIVYDPDIYVTHNHRNSKFKLYLQLYHYGVGMVCFQLITLFRDGDFRALKFLLIDHPAHHFRRLFGGKKYPLSMLLAEVVGNVVAPVSLMRAGVALLMRSKKSTGDEVKSTGQ
jgi:GT2 family glycosyltransferase